VKKIMSELIKVEKQTQIWMGAFIAILSVIYGLSSLGRVEWVNYISIIFGFFLSGFLLIEGGIFAYFREKKYKVITFGDIITITTMIISALTLLNTLLLFKAVRMSAPIWLLDFSKTTGVIVAIAGGIIGIIYLFAGKVKN
jgi:hypothetical protein